jgi:hypothetical protein
LVVLGGVENNEGMLIYGLIFVDIKIWIEFGMSMSKDLNRYRIDWIVGKDGRSIKVEEYKKVLFRSLYF